jgi:hypothetical protein
MQIMVLQIEEKLKDNPNYFFKNTGFLDFVLDLVPHSCK